MAAARREAAAAAWALAATLYWCGFVVLLFLTFSLLTLLVGWIGFVLLRWAIGQGGEGRPDAFAWIAATLSCLYWGAASTIAGIAAFIESHGCAVAAEPCTGEGIGLMWTVAAAAILAYLAAAWLTIRIRMRRTGEARPK